MPFFGRPYKNDRKELKTHASGNTDLSQEQLIYIRISDAQSLRRRGRGFSAVGGRTVALDIELVVCRCGTLTKTRIMTLPVHQAHHESFVQLLEPLRAVRQSSTVQKKPSSVYAAAVKETKQQADIVRTIYRHPRAHNSPCHGKMLRSSSSIEVVSAAAAAAAAGRRFIVIASLHPSHGMAVGE